MKLLILFILIKINMQGKNEDITIHEKMRDVLSKETIEILPPWRGIEKPRSLEATRKIDEVMNKTEVGNGNSRNKLGYLKTFGRKYEIMASIIVKWRRKSERV